MEAQRLGGSLLLLSLSSRSSFCYLSKLGLREPYCTILKFRILQGSAPARAWSQALLPCQVSHPNRHHLSRIQTTCRPPELAADSKEIHEIRLMLPFEASSTVTHVEKSPVSELLRMESGIPSKHCTILEMMQYSISW